MTKPNEKVSAVKTNFDLLIKIRAGGEEVTLGSSAPLVADGGNDVTSRSSNRIKRVSRLP